MRGLVTMSKRIEKLLKQHRHLKDDDMKLVANVWHQDLIKIGKDPYVITAFDMLQAFAMGKLSNTETIRRTRQKIQELHPSLRGKSYKNRKTVATKEVIQQLRQIK